MSETMLALVKTKKGVGNIELLERPKPSPGEGEVLIEVHACGVCGTDIHVKHDRFPYWPPVILGHEFAGRIVELGPGTKLYQIGDRVVGEPHTRACGHCHLCRTGNIQICPDKRSPGWGIDGAMARWLVMPEKLLHAIPDSMSYTEAALVEPTANVVSDVLERARVEGGDYVVVLGPGPIGLLAGLAAKAAGAREVLMLGTEKDEEIRLSKARELGMDTFVIGHQGDPIAAVMDRTRGIGADLVIECSGAAPAIALGIDLVRKLGRFCAIGLTGQEKTSFPYDKAMFKVCTIICNLSTLYASWDRAISLIATGQIPAGKLISHAEPLTNWEKVFDDIENLRALKAVLLPL